MTAAFVSSFKQGAYASILGYIVLILAITGMNAQGLVG